MRRPHSCRASGADLQFPVRPQGQSSFLGFVLSQSHVGTYPGVAGRPPHHTFRVSQLVKAPVSAICVWGAHTCAQALLGPVRRSRVPQSLGIRDELRSGVGARERGSWTDGWSWALLSCAITSHEPRTSWGTRIHFPGDNEKSRVCELRSQTTLLPALCVPGAVLKCVSSTLEGLQTGTEQSAVWLRSPSCEAAAPGSHLAGWPSGRALPHATEGATSEL